MRSTVQQTKIRYNYIYLYFGFAQDRLFASAL
jgi:hypothetical protein